ncbi:DUF4129 domain-containing protein [Halorientalis sp.]|uniref:DUF4129 domain-containing protein n=1 Tax=Halorientalis sp. TaxID=1931229 RepID=UPI00261E24C1|nr:DUF4129 domain-containing protein [Halorientalis sp.]
MAEGERSARRRRLALLVLCALGLFVAAFAAPQVEAGLGLGSGGPGESPDAPSGGSGGEIGFGDAVEELLRLLSDDESADGELPGSCTVRFVAEPTPGARISVVVTDEDGRVEGARVSLDGAVVGRTGERGTVPVEVPYEQQLALEATLPSGSTCATNRAADGSRAAVGAASAAIVPAAAGTEASGSVPGNAADHERADQDGGEDTGGPRVTRGVTVDGDVRVAVEGEPIPGERVALAASIDGKPMREATVTVDGEQVGTTDDGGRYGLEIPTDGRDTLTVRVERGEFGGETTVEVTELRAVVNPVTVLAVPGADAVVTARLGDRTVANATVTLDGQRLGTTDADGRFRFSLPADPTAVVELRSGMLTTRQSLLGLYALTGLVVLLAVLALSFAAARLASRTASVTTRAISLAERLRRVTRWLVAFAFRATAALERLLDWLAARLRALRTALVSLWRRRPLGAVRDWTMAALAWLLALPGRTRAVVGRVWTRLCGLPGPLRGSGTGTDDGSPGEGGVAATSRTASRRAPPGLRERWRAFARWVAPERWPQRTPGEVAREASEAGFPRGSVRDLTRVFRDVEYGDRPETPEREERARTAFDSLRDHREAADDDADDSSGEAEREVSDGE